MNNFRFSVWIAVTRCLQTLERDEEKQYLPIWQKMTLAWLFLLLSRPLNPLWSSSWRNHWFAIKNKFWVRLLSKKISGQTELSGCSESIELLCLSKQNFGSCDSWTVYISSVQSKESISQTESPHLKNRRVPSIGYTTCSAHTIKPS